MSPGMGQRSQQLMLASFCHSQRSLEHDRPRGSTSPQLAQQGGHILEMTHSLLKNEMEAILEGECN